jgi:hypothetical protein
MVSETLNLWFDIQTKRFDEKRKKASGENPFGF